tara:strand:- start:147 stop:350 length:204 start_codon:yes stop_codon:yes gene_type:complete
MEKKKAVKKAVKKVEKPVKVSLKDKLTETVNFIEKAVKEERGINLNTSACAKLNKAAFTINTIIKNL